MIASAEYELCTLLISVLLGAACVVVYEVMQSLNPGKTPKAFWDAAAWAAAGGTAVWGWHCRLGGVIRWYMLAGFILGAVLSFLTVGLWVYRIFSSAVKKIYSFFNIFLKFLLTAMKFLGKIVLNILNVCRLNKCKKVVEGNNEKKA